jgi:predicted  nucleic acid-binding Zn-ribbon protein
VTDAAKLHDLQKIDTNWEKVRRKLLQLQKQLEEPEEVRAARARLAETETGLHAAQASQQSAELEAQGLAERIRSGEQRLMSGAVHNPKELEALQASVAALRRQRAGVDDVGVAAMMEGEELAAHHAEQQAALASLERSWAARHAELAQEDAKLRRLAVQLKAQRARLVESLPPEDTALYEDLRKRKAGVAVAVVENGLCAACHVRLPTGVASAARSGREPVYCTSCGRILAG